VVHGELRSHARGNILPGGQLHPTLVKAGLALAERTIGDGRAWCSDMSQANVDGLLTGWLAAHQRIDAHTTIRCRRWTTRLVRQVHSRLEEAAQMARVVQGLRAHEQAHTRRTTPSWWSITLPSDRTVMVNCDVPDPIPRRSQRDGPQTARRWPCRNCGSPNCLGYESSIPASSPPRLTAQPRTRAIRQADRRR
jgi:alpha-mannosidase